MSDSVHCPSDYQTHADIHSINWKPFCIRSVERVDVAPPIEGDATLRQAQKQKDDDK